ncbi:two-component response regulator ARR17-like [Ipomoea triloba]|uniref:two-component response regulator ARR17-like n=1 Tax=Ipomoea triloba TaxID=35885 RepID=UPI00125E4685|nr:two-component response regulator ARR17-like [Ipomoea triloba]
MACPSSSMAMGENGEDEVIHVLAVDDDPVNLIILEKLLKASSCKVTAAENGMRALEYLGLLGDDDQHNTPNTNVPRIDLIITDYSMPGINGYQLLKKVKESAMLKDVPVVVMSSENVPSIINQCLEEGALKFMPKPLNRSDVKHLISQLP